MSAGKLNQISVPISWGNVQAVGKEHMLYILEPGMACRLFSKMFLYMDLTRYQKMRILFICIIVVPSVVDEPEETPMFTRAFF